MPIFGKRICPICWTLDLQLKGVERRLKIRIGAFSPSQHHQIRFCHRINHQQRIKTRIHVGGLVRVYGNQGKQKMGHHQHFRQCQLSRLRSEIHRRVKNILTVPELHEPRKRSSQNWSYQNSQKRLFLMGNWRVHHWDAQTLTWRPQQTGWAYGLRHHLGKNLLSNKRLRNAQTSFGVSASTQSIRKDNQGNESSIKGKGFGRDLFGDRRLVDSFKL